MLATATSTAQPLQPVLLVSIREAARMLAISERSLWTLIERGDLNPVRIGDRSTRLWASDLHEYAMKNTTRR